jgi:hypothetical protein
VGQIHAPSVGVAGIGGARVVVVAIEGAAPGAGTVHTGIPQGAGVTIIASGLIGDVKAPLCGITGIRRTGVLVITVLRLTWLAGPADARIPGGACIAIFTGTGSRRIDALALGIALVLGADIAVIAVLGGPRYADGVGAGIPLGTRVTIVARLGIGGMDALARIGIAGIRRTGIVIITLKKQFPGNAFSLDAMVTEGTGIPIIAGQCVGFMYAADSGVTVIVGAEITVVLANQCNALADGIKTLIVSRTEVTVFAGSRKNFTVAT